ncbi:hypothetical protein AALP_AA8G311100 [Arabis alpina]|uniref:Uncharacterized protein n=1 Tax=Arabis alpina TaxID=50452 RepID=A0A087GAM6_ARAAL|nr:hypothetical protein AALP_AA8G311100 [Arabis alpina]
MIGVIYSEDWKVFRALLRLKVAKGVCARDSKQMVDGGNHTLALVVSGKGMDFRYRKSCGGGDRSSSTLNRRVSPRVCHAFIVIFFG